MSTTGSPPVRFPSGVATSPKGYVFGEYPQGLTPPRVNEYFNDFNTYAAGDWTVTATTGTSALIDANGGKLVQTTAASASDTQAQQLVKKSYAFTAGAQLWFSINVALNDVTNTAFAAGMTNSISALTPTDGVYFNKLTATNVLNAVIRAASVSTTIPLGVLAINTPYTLSFYYDGKPTPTLYFFTTIGLATPTAFAQPYFSGGNQINGEASADGANPNTLVNLPPPSTLLDLGFGIASTAVASVKTATVDYVLGSCEILTRF